MIRGSRLEARAAARPWLTALACCMAGCTTSSPPLHYYTLTEIPGASRQMGSGAAVAVRLERVTLAPELDRAQLVRRIDATQLQIMEDHLWAAPLEDTLRRVLSADLASRLPAGSVANPNEPSAGEKRRLLSVDILDFYGDTSCAVSLRAAWVLRGADLPSTQGNEEVHLPAPGKCSGAQSLPGAMSEALAQLSELLAARIALPR